MTTHEFTQLAFGRDRIVDVNARRGMRFTPISPEEREILEQEYAKDFARSKARHEAWVASIRPR